ncbi:MAG TPA: NADH-quinone oxidoreductase subunit N [Nitrospiria bacterium]|jgi:NADH-quinone oxidoreductase subunit N
MTFPITDLYAILPELIIVLYACIILVFDPFISNEKKVHLAWTSLLALGLAFFASYRFMSLEIEAFSGMFILDPFSTFFKFLFYTITAITILMSINYLKLEGVHLGEYYAFLLLATSGMMLMVSGSDLITIYLGLELTAISLYVLAGFKRFEPKSTEASAKYFVLSSFSSGILLYGISLLYGLTGTTHLKGVSAFIVQTEFSGPALILAVILLVIGFGFKVAAVPFHMWAPDVYQGAPTSVTAFMSVGPKAASFAIFLRVFLEAFGGIKENWTALLIVLSVATMILGNVVAISQTNIKRMLAYSSIAHAGYALIGLVVGNQDGISSLLLYLFIYAFMNLGAFGVVILIRRGEMEGVEIKDFSGLAKRNPLAALVMLVFMFSLTGIPPTAGFIGKFYIFMAAVQADLVWLAVIGVLLSAVSAYYYLRVVMVMYMQEPEQEFELATSPAMSIALLVAVGVIMAIGVYPDPIVSYAQSSILNIQ